MTTKTSEDNKDDIQTRLEKLKKLYDDNLIEKDEYDQKRKLLIEEL